MNMIDIIAGLIVLTGAVRGWMRGFTEELIALLRTAGAVAAGLFLYRQTGLLLLQYTRMNAETAYLASFFIVMLGAYLIFFVVSLLVKKALEPMMAPGLNRAAGGVLGMIKAAALAAFLLIGLSFWPHERVQQAVTADSWAGSLICRRARTVYEKWREERPALPEWKRPEPESE